MTSVQRLRLFVERAEELDNTKLVKNGFHVSLNLKGGVDQPLQMTPSFPDEEALKSFLITFRHFIMKREPVFLQSIHDVAYQHIASDTHRSHIVANREALKTAISNTGMGLTYNQRELSPAETADLYINSIYFHNDERGQFLKKLLAHEQPVLKLHFLNWIIGITDRVLYAAQVIRDAFDKGLVSDERVAEKDVR